MGETNMNNYNQQPTYSNQPQKQTFQPTFRPAHQQPILPQERKTGRRPDFTGRSGNLLLSAWINQDKYGKDLISLVIGDKRYTLFPNTQKEKSNQP